MNINAIPIISVSYNSPELIQELLDSFRKFYTNPITIIDGSSDEIFKQVENVCNNYQDVNFIHFDYNIHHGPGLAWAFQNLQLSGPVLVIDSDVIVLNAGFLETLLAELQPDMYGVGAVRYVNEGGYDIEYEKGAIRYLHPACMLCNIEVVREWPMPTKHGAPMINPMVAIHKSGEHQLISSLNWVEEDFAAVHSDMVSRNYLHHDYQGTVKRSGGYNLTEWDKARKDEALLTHTVLSLLPEKAQRYMELGSNNGSLSRAIKNVRPDCYYISVETDPRNYAFEKGASDIFLNHDATNLDDDFFQKHTDVDCWILSEILELIKDPLHLLQQIRKILPPYGSIIAIIPNFQHWSIQAKLCIGDFRYQDNGLINKKHLHCFTRATIFELFEKSGFRITQGFPIIFDKLENQNIIFALQQLALSVGAEPGLVIDDSQATYYIIIAKQS